MLMANDSITQWVDNTLLYLRYVTSCIEGPTLKDRGLFCKKSWLVDKMSLKNS